MNATLYHHPHGHVSPIHHPMDCCDYSVRVRDTNLSSDQDSQFFPDRFVVIVYLCRQFIIFGCDQCSLWYAKCSWSSSSSATSRWSIRRDWDEYFFEELFRMCRLIFGVIYGEEEDTNTNRINYIFIKYYTMAKERLRLWFSIKVRCVVRLIKLNKTHRSGSSQWSCVIYCDFD